jgi:hypothetical protein
MELSALRLGAVSDVEAAALDALCRMKASLIGVTALTRQERRRCRWSVDTFIDGILGISLLSAPVGKSPQF